MDLPVPVELFEKLNCLEMQQFDNYWFWGVIDNKEQSDLMRQFTQAWVEKHQNCCVGADGLLHFGGPPNPEEGQQIPTTKNL
jgi:hypothetical protein